MFLFAFLFIFSFFFRFMMTGRLSGGHQAAVMCMEVSKLSNEEDLVITGSKDHYIKVCELAKVVRFKVG